MKTEILTDNITTASEVICAGGLVAVPTETVYGLAASGLDEIAVKRIYDVKGRPEVKPLSLMVADDSWMEKYCEDVPVQAHILAKKFWPGPLTIILKSKDNVPDIVRAGGSTVGLRCPDHPMTLKLIRKAQLPLAAPSANPSGKPSPKTAGEVAAYFNGTIDAIIDGGECSLGLESTIIDMSQTPYRILRQGALEEKYIVSELAESLNIIGITGGTGCGKTTALNVLRDFGAEIIDADEVYHDLVATSEPMRQEIIDRFGMVYDGFVLDRKRLGAIVFNDKQALEDLNKITHKYVSEETWKRLGRFAMNGGRIAAVDAIGLIGGAFYDVSIFNVAVTAPTEDRVKRLMAREGISEDYARTRIAAQHTNEYFQQNCDYVLHNDSDIDSFEIKCKNFFTEVLSNVR